MKTMVKGAILTVALSGLITVGLGCKKEAAPVNPAPKTVTPPPVPTPPPAPAAPTTPPSGS